MIAGITHFRILASSWLLSKALDGYRVSFSTRASPSALCVPRSPFPMGVTHFRLAFAILPPMLLSSPHRVALFFRRLCERLKKSLD